MEATVEFDSGPALCSSVKVGSDFFGTGIGWHPKTGISYFPTIESCSIVGSNRLNFHVWDGEWQPILRRLDQLQVHNLLKVASVKGEQVEVMHQTCGRNKCIGEAETVGLAVFVNQGHGCIARCRVQSHVVVAIQ